MTENEYVKLTAKVRLELVLNQLRDISGYIDSDNMSKARVLLSNEYQKLLSEACIDVS